MGDQRGEPAAADSVLLLDVVRGALHRHGAQHWPVLPDHDWCGVVPPQSAPRRHGWKLHVSATPLSAPLVLARATEVLVRHGCPFKFATDIAGVLRLVSPDQDRGSGGKFITAYPSGDEQIVALAEELDQATAGLTGPRILSDRPLRPGSLVHYRYGEFSTDLVFNDEGLFEAWMVGPDGSEVRDERQPWFSPPPWAVSPFPEPEAPARAPGAPMMLGGRFRVTGVFRHANKGGVFKAVDEQDGRPVVIKQGRAHVAAALDGTDIRDMLRHEARMLQAAPPGLFPAFVALFEEQGDLFLAEEYVPGRALDDRAADDAIDPHAVAGQLVRAVRTAHEAGLVLCDLKPGNVVVTPDGTVRLIDAELVTGEGRHPVRGFTFGFAAPEIIGSAADGTAPRPPADCFSLGVTLFHLAGGGLDAHWVAGRPGTPRSGPERRRLLARIAAGRPPLGNLAELIAGLTETDPDQRWTLARAERFLAAPPPAPATPPPAATGPALGGAIDRLLADGTEHLRREMTPHETNLWRSGLAGLRHDPCDTWRGAAGVLAVLTRAAALLDDPALRPLVTQTAEWVDAHLSDVPRTLPGLWFGRAGTAWSLHAAARFLGDDALAAHALRLARALPTSGPHHDIAYGQSGAGLALLHLWRQTGDAALRDAALDCAESVLAGTRRDGADWLWPRDSGSGPHSAFGFAHGVAGVGTFLLEAATAEAGDRAERCLRAAIGAGDTLLRAARPGAGASPAWPARAGDSDIRAGQEYSQWCNGPVGIGAFLLRLGAATGRQPFTDTAIRCAPPATDDWAVSMGACCGLAGSGHFLLDLAGHTSDERFRARAEHMADVIDAQSVAAGDLRITCRADTGHAYAGGTAGVLDFLLRVRHGGPHPWLPALPGLPLAAASGNPSRPLRGGESS